MVADPLPLHFPHFGREADRRAGALILRVEQPAALIVVQNGHPFFHGRGRDGGCGGCGVPIRCGAHFVGQVVAMAVFDGDLDFPLETDWVFKMENVGRLIAPLSSPQCGGVGAFPDRTAVAEERIVLHAPGLIEVILRTCPVKIGRPLITVHPDHVISLAPPSALKIGHTQVATDIVAAPFCFEYHVVVFPSEAALVDNIGFRGVDGDFAAPTAEGIGAAKFGVKVTGLLRPIGERFVINVKILSVGLGAFIDQLDARARSEGHGHVAVERTACVELIGGAG